MAKHKVFTVATSVIRKVPGSAAPTMLLRKYFTRGTDLSAHSQAQFDQVALGLNQRPKKL
jgi:hypothetical protein